MKLDKNQSIVVTGGSGLIGSSVIRSLNDLGFTKIIVVDDLKQTEKWQNLVGKSYQDLLLKDRFFAWLEGRQDEIQAIIHLGACSSTVEKDANYLLENNYRFSQKLASWAIGHKKRFIYASSAATYGGGELGFADIEDDLEKLRPLNMYGYSKHMFDLWLKMNGQLKNVVGLKYFNVFGPNEWHKGRMASAILHFTRQIKETGCVKLFKSTEPSRFSDGGQMRDFIYVKDAASMTVAFLDNSATGLFNIGSGAPRTWNELASLVFKGLEIKPKIEYIELPEDLKGKYQNYTSADVSKLKKTLGTKMHTMPFEESVVEYVKGHLVPHKFW